MIPEPAQHIASMIKNEIMRVVVGEPNKMNETVEGSEPITEEDLK